MVKVMVMCVCVCGRVEHSGGGVKYIMEYFYVEKVDENGMN